MVVGCDALKYPVRAGRRQGAEMPLLTDIPRGTDRAHCDTWPDDNPDSLNQGTMFYKAVKEGLLDPASSVQVGLRTWNDDCLGLNILDAPTVLKQGVEATVARINEIQATLKDLTASRISGNWGRSSSGGGGRWALYFG